MNSDSRWRRRCILRSCPRLQTLRLQHSCAGRQSLGAAKQPSTSHGLSPALQARLASGKRNGGRVDDFGRQAAASPRCLRGCSTVTDKGFRGIATHSRSLTSVTLLFQVGVPRTLNATKQQMTASASSFYPTPLLRFPFSNTHSCGCERQQELFRVRS